VISDQVVEMEEDLEEGGIRIGDIYLPPPPPPACTFDSNGPRIVITHIENTFFKSYAGKQVLGPFHKSFSSVVGPNGSGKSNVIDGMLFVFGYRAQKTRSKKISNLIHNSENHPNVQSCTVSVIFEKIIDINDEEFETVPNTKLIVSRTAYKDNSSFYQINGKRCQFKEVAKVLRAEGIDLDHNRFLILQGEVEQISMMKPKALTEHDSGMLEYLEDIIGSHRFKNPIELLAKRVEELNELREEKLNRVKMVEKEKDELEGPKDIAVAHIKKENAITMKKHVLYQGFICKFNATKKDAEEKKQAIDDGLADVKKELAELSNEKKEKEGGMKQLGSKLEAALKLKEECSQRFGELEQEDVKLGEDIQHKNTKRKKLNVEIKNTENKLEEYASLPAKNEKKIEECEHLKQKHIENRTKEEAAYAKAMESLNSETQQLQDEKQGYETKLIDLRKVVDETKSALDIAQSEKDIYLSTERSEVSKLEKIKSSLESSKETVTKRTEEIEKLQTAIPEYKEKIEEAKRVLQEVVPELSTVEKELNKQRMKLEESRSAMNSSRSRGRVLDAIMSANINGVMGRLGDLGGIDSKYDVAISTACGPLDNIVVDTVETAKRCINLLKQKNAGVATFIALEKMEKWRGQASQRIDTPENVPRLFDLIKMEDNVRTAFYYAIRDTLVANNLEQASRIAYGRIKHRVVTLNGELIETSGTMSGGGKSKMRGRMGRDAQAVKVSPQEVEALDRAIEGLSARQSALRRQRADSENLLTSANRDARQMEHNLQKFRLEVHSCKQQMETLQKQERVQMEKVGQVKSDPKKVKEMEKVIEGKQKTFNEASEKANEVEAEVTKINKQIQKITGGKMKALKKNLDELDKKLEMVKAEITKLGVEIKTVKRNTKKSEDKLESMKAEKTQLEEDMTAFAERKKEVEADAAKILAELEAASTSENSLKAEIGSVKELYDEVLRRENAIKESKIKQDQEMEQFSGMIQDCKGSLRHWGKKLAKLELQEVPVRASAPEEGEEEEEPVLRTLEEEQLQELDLKALEYELEIMESEIKESRPNLAAIAEYRRKEEVYLARVAELTAITASRDDQRKHHDNLRKQRLNEFMAGFHIISNKLKEMYQMITLGGDAELELVDSLDPFSEGIEFSVRPPYKSWKNITNLSGGEKTLSSLALVFALHYYKPSPLYVMDEIDAALDFKNVSIVANYIKDRTKNAQFIIISLRSQTFELADRLVGIYKTYNQTKSITINPGKYDTAGKLPQPACAAEPSASLPEPVLAN